MADGELENLETYLDAIGADLDDHLPEAYCKNEAVNLLLASYSARAAECGVSFVTDTRLPSELPIGSTALCTLLGGDLDNAYQAARAVAGPGEKSVRLMAKLSDGKLLIQVQNPYSGAVWMENGLPRGAGEHRGFGVRSMEALVEKHGGRSSYEAREGVFTLRIAI